MWMPEQRKSFTEYDLNNAQQLQLQAAKGSPTQRALHPSEISNQMQGDSN